MYKKYGQSSFAFHEGEILVEGVDCGFTEVYGRSYF